MLCPYFMLLSTKGLILQVIMENEVKLQTQLPIGYSMLSSEFHLLAGDRKRGGTVVAQKS